jgi:small subunit ribosomal protein S2
LIACQQLVFQIFMKITLEQILLAGMHLGQPTQIWNPKISSYTFGVRNGIRLIDLVKTREGLKKAQEFLKRRRGNGILFVGTKKKAAHAIEERAKSSKSFFVNSRWLGGMLTNWSTIEKSLLQLYRIEREQSEGMWTTIKKKKVYWLKNRLNRLEKYFGGLKGIQKIPGVVIVVDQKVEIVSIQECRKLGIPVICTLDTDCDPDLVELGVPINDDSTESIQVFLKSIRARIREGQRQPLSQNA